MAYAMFSSERVKVIYCRNISLKHIHVFLRFYSDDGNLMVVAESSVFSKTFESSSDFNLRDILLLLYCDQIWVECLLTLHNNLK